MRCSAKTANPWFWIRAVVCTALVTLLCLQSASSQTKPVDQTAGTLPCAPPRTTREYWKRHRAIPVRFTEVEGNTLYWKFQDKTGIDLGSFQLESFSLFYDEKPEKKDRRFFEFNLKKTEWGIEYDSECFYIWSATRLKSQP